MKIQSSFSKAGSLARQLYLAACNPRTVARAVQFAFVLVSAGIALIHAPDLFAQSSGKTIGDIGQSINQQGSGVASAVRIVIYIIGFGMVGVGLFKWATASKKNEPMGWGVMMTVFGSLMLAVTYIINSTTMTFFGTGVQGSDATTVLGN